MVETSSFLKRLGCLIFGHVPVRPRYMTDDIVRITLNGPREKPEFSVAINPCRRCGCLAAENVAP